MDDFCRLFCPRCGVGVLVVDGDASLLVSHLWRVHRVRLRLP